MGDGSSISDAKAAQATDSVAYFCGLECMELWKHGGEPQYIEGILEGGVPEEADTGSAVKGHVIDVWMPTREQALAWGRRTLTITLH